MGGLCADNEGDCGDGWGEEVLVDGEEDDGLTCFAKICEKTSIKNMENLYGRF